MGKHRIIQIVAVIMAVFIIPPVLALEFLLVLANVGVGVFTPQNPYTVTSTPSTIEFDGVQYELRDDVYTVALLGLQQQAEENILAGPQADTIVLMTVDKAQGKTFLLSVSRDMYSTIFMPDVSGGVSYTEHGPVCNAYAYAGAPEITQRPLDGGLFTTASLSERLYNAPINRFAGVNMEVITSVVDALGGVEVKIGRDFAHIAQVEPGDKHVLDGETAELYLRLRSFDGMSGENTDRMRRQQQFISAFIDTLIAELLSDPLTPFNLYSAIMPHLATDMNLHEMVFIGNAFLLSDVVMETLPGTKVGEEFIVDEDFAQRYIIEHYYKTI